MNLRVAARAYRSLRHTGHEYTSGLDTNIFCSWAHVAAHSDVRSPVAPGPGSHAGSAQVQVRSAVGNLSVSGSGAGHASGHSAWPQCGARARNVTVLAYD